MSVKGRPTRPLTPVQRRELAAAEDKPAYLRRLRQRLWLAEARRKEPAKFLAAQRRKRLKYVQLGYYRRGGKYYSSSPPTAKRRAYRVWYNKHIRPVRRFKYVLLPFARILAASRAVVREMGHEV